MAEGDQQVHVYGFKVKFFVVRDKIRSNRENFILLLYSILICFTAILYSYSCMGVVGCERALQRLSRSYTQLTRAFHPSFLRFILNDGLHQIHIRPLYVYDSALALQ